MIFVFECLQIVSELPAGTNWNFDVHWYPKIPGVISASSFDGKIGIYNIEVSSQFLLQIYEKDNCLTAEPKMTVMMGHLISGLWTFSFVNQKEKWNDLCQMSVYSCIIVITPKLRACILIRGF